MSYCSFSSKGHVPIQLFQARALRRQKGFSLVEVSIVTAIVLLLAIIGVPAIGNYVVENKVPKVGEEVARFILQTRVNASASSAEPYSAIDTNSFARMVQGSSLFSVVDSGGVATVSHGLGKEGQVVVQSADLGAAFSITLSNVSHVACPSIASILQRMADTITVSGVTVKDDTTPYSALTTQANCEQGDGNTFVFTTG